MIASPTIASIGDYQGECLRTSQRNANSFCLVGGTGNFPTAEYLLVIYEDLHLNEPALLSARHDMEGFVFTLQWENEL